MEALRQAIQVGLDDIERGAFDSFDTPEALSAHLALLAEEVLGSLPECAAQLPHKPCPQIAPAP